MNLFYLSLKLKGLPINKANQFLNKIQQMNQNKFNKWQKQKKWEIFEFHYLNNSAYHEWININTTRKPTNWNDIPIITKTEIQFPLSKRLTKGYKMKNVYINNTSGSSGHPFFFAKDKFCHALAWAINMERYSWHGITYGESLQARFYGIPLTKLKYIKERVKDYISARIRFPVFDLSDRVLDSFIPKFKQHPFVYVNGYTSSLVLFAKHLIKCNIVLKNLCPTLKVVIPTSEVLSQSDRILLQKGFGVPVINEYGASELGIMAFEDKEGTWMLNNEQLLIEVVDDQNEPVAPGQSGRILITDLYNKAMPFIRYDIGDIGSIATIKKKNNQILTSLQGRTNDMAILPSGKRSPGLTFYYISKSLLEGGGGMREFIIKQLKPDLFHFEYVADDPLTDYQKDQVLDALKQYLEPGLKASFEQKTQIERTTAGKLKHFQYLVKE